MGRHILVTGGAGFIGSHLTRRLLERGERVTALDDFNDFYDPALKRENAAAFAGRADWQLVEGDIRDAALVDGLFERERFDAVVHLAARAGVRPSLREPILYEEVNCIGTLRPARGRAPPRAVELRLRLLLVGLRHQRESPLRRGRSGRPADLALRHDQARRRAALLQLLAPLRPAHLLPALLHGLRAGAAAGDGDRQVHRPARAGREHPALRHRPVPARLHLHRRHRRRHRGAPSSWRRASRSSTSAARRPPG